jgi:hypothetical protein
MPTFTASAARAGAVPAASDNVAAPVPAKTDRRLICVITPSSRVRILNSRRTPAVAGSRASD